MIHKKVRLFACIEKNLGDDLFIYLVCNRYKNVKFEISSNAKYLKVNNIQNLKYSYFLKFWLNISNRNSNKLIKSIIVNVENYIFKIIIPKKEAIYIVGNALKNENYSSSKQIRWLKRRIDISSKFYLLSTNYGPSNSKNWLKDCKNVLKKMTDVCFRDKISYDLFKDLKNVRYAPDAVLTLYINKSRSDRNKKYILISVIDCKMNNRNIKLQESADIYEKKMIDVVNLYNKDGYDVILFNSNREQDEPASKRIYDKCIDKSKVHIYNYSGNLNEVFELYENAKAIIATRLHTIILGFLYDIPVVPIIYDIKVKNLLLSYDFNGYKKEIFDLKDFTFEEVKNNINNYEFKISKELIKDANNQFLNTDELLK